jgi:hypothetical protein
VIGVRVVDVERDIFLVVEGVAVGEHLVALADLAQIRCVHGDQSERAGVTRVDVGAHLRPAVPHRPRKRAGPPAENEVHVA